MKHPEIHKVVLGCGKVNYSNNVHRLRFRRNLDFEVSMQQISGAVLFYGRYTAKFIKFPAYFVRIL